MIAIFKGSIRSHFYPKGDVGGIVVLQVGRTEHFETDDGDILPEDDANALSQSHVALWITDPKIRRDLFKQGRKFSLTIRDED